MPSPYGTSVETIWSARLIEKFYATSFYNKFVNDDYFSAGSANKSIVELNQKFNISTLYGGTWTTYSGADITDSNVTESVATLTIDNFKYLSDKILEINRFKSAVKNPKSTVIKQAAANLKIILEQAVTAMYPDAGAGNWIGTSYTASTVTVAVTTGVVTGAATTFTAAMVGRPFKAVGHTKWFRVKTYTSATSITIEDDLDDETSVYTGGAIGGGTAYEIQAATVLAITSSNIAATLAKAAGFLSSNEIPEDERSVFMPALARGTLLAATQFASTSLVQVYKDVAQDGMVGRAYGFDIYLVPENRLPGDNVSGFYCIFGHKSWLTAGFGYLSPTEIVKPEANFGQRIKALVGYGFKVADERRKAAGVIFATFA